MVAKAIVARKSLGPKRPCGFDSRNTLQSLVFVSPKFGHNLTTFLERFSSDSQHLAPRAFGYPFGHAYCPGRAYQAAEVAAHALGSQDVGFVVLAEIIPEVAALIEDLDLELISVSQIKQE